MITEGIDFYKFTMGQVLFQQEQHAVVEYTFKNRGGSLRLDMLALQERFDEIREEHFYVNELAFLLGKGLSPEYVDYLRTHDLPRVQIKDGDIRVEGPAPLASLWETIILSEINEWASRETWPGNFRAGVDKLMHKIQVLSAYPQIQFSDFGTRRRCSRDWQLIALTMLKAGLPNQFLGTSNVGFAMKLDIKPIGSFAHEMPMIWAALADLRGEDILASHAKFLDVWRNTYGPYTYALTDTFGSDFFFRTVHPKTWLGLRHDSGDPFEFGEKALRFYLSKGVDPLGKILLFSDGLDMETIIRLHERFKGRIVTRFGWGTNLMNDMGTPTTNIVMKATKVTLNGRSAGTVKLSDVPGKNTGSPANIARYLDLLGVRRPVVA